MIAVIEAGAKQYLVEEGQTIETELVGDDKTMEFTPLLVIDGDKVQVGKPTVTGAKVTAEVTEADQKADKVKVLKYKAKKRQKTLTGHRQHQSVLTIKKISVK